MGGDRSRPGRTSGEAATPVPPLAPETAIIGLLARQEYLIGLRDEIFERFPDYWETVSQREYDQERIRKEVELGKAAVPLDPDGSSYKVLEGTADPDAYEGEDYMEL